MVNPTGYTALDLIGFTDKGPYLSSENYVKNDLVHYSGNIWRCLIDDTTGIAPVEGVNWTLFIGEPTNLVERIIAPVETDPATNAWTVGRQIIFNDNLYEVIAAITAGDSLVAYEDDPTNANIKLADPVETQLLNLKGNISNKNLLDNPWFTVNQRGLSSYAAGSSGNRYTVDRWCTTNAETSVDVASDGITITHSGSASTNGYLLQLHDYTDEEYLFGKTLTYSCIYDENGTDKISTVTFTVPNAIPSETVELGRLEDEQNNALGSVYWIISGSNHHMYVRLYSGMNSSRKFKAVKLELGSISTLAMDIAPNYAEELLKCQRYFQKIDKNTRWRITGYNANTFRTTIRTVPMRTTPTLSNATLELRSLDEGTTKTSTTQGASGSEDILIYASYNAHGFTDGQIYVPSTSDLWLSADL